MIIYRDYFNIVCIDLIPTDVGDDCNLCSEDSRYNISQEEICQKPWNSQFGNQTYPDLNQNHHLCDARQSLNGERKKHCMAACDTCSTFIYSNIY